MASTCHIEATRTMAAATAPTTGRVLVVEDDAAIRELLRLHLSLAGFEIAEVADGRIALERARAATFDVIVLDVMLPGIDGVTLCRAVRADTPNANTGISTHASRSNAVPSASAKRRSSLARVQSLGFA